MRLNSWTMSQKCSCIINKSYPMAEKSSKRSFHKSSKKFLLWTSNYSFTILLLLWHFSKINFLIGSLYHEICQLSFEADWGKCIRLPPASKTKTNAHLMDCSLFPFFSVIDESEREKKKKNRAQIYNLLTIMKKQF